LKGFNHSIHTDYCRLNLIFGGFFIPFGAETF
jgi:hypothetical protein